MQQSELLAIRAVADNVAATNRLMDELRRDMREVRDVTLELKAQELKVAIQQVRVDLAGDIREIRTNHDHEYAELKRELERLRDHDEELERKVRDRCEELEERLRDKDDGLAEQIANNKADILRIQGRILPIGGFLMLVAAAGVSWFFNVAGSVFVGAHHP